MGSPSLEVNRYFLSQMSSDASWNEIASRLRGSIFTTVFMVPGGAPLFLDACTTRADARVAGNTQPARCGLALRSETVVSREPLRTPHGSALNTPEPPRPSVFGSLARTQDLVSGSRA